MAIVTIGRIENKVGFSIDRKSWRNLDKYQKRLKQLKQQMKSLPSGPVGYGPARPGGGRGAGGSPRSSQHGAHVSARERYLRDLQRRQDMVRAREIRTQGFLGRSNLPEQQRQQFTAQIAELSRQFLKGKLTSREYSAHIGVVQSQMSKANREFKTFNQRFKEMRNLLIAGGAAYAGLQAGGEVVRTGQTFEATEAKFLIGTGSIEKANEGLAFARAEAKRLGLDLITTADSYARLAIAARDKMPEKQVKGLFTAFSELGTAAGIDPERMKLGARALEQMLNKGTLMAEEVGFWPLNHFNCGDILIGVDY